MSPNFRIKLKRNSISSDATGVMPVEENPIKSNSKSTSDSDRRRSSGVTVDITDDEPSINTSESSRLSSRSKGGQHLKSCFADKTSSRSRSMRRSVHFDKVEFRAYPIILSDNPCPSSGPPIGLGWSYDHEDTLESDLDSYEAHRDDAGGRREKYELRIPPEVRFEMLYNAGYNARDITTAVKQAREWRENLNSSLKYRKYDMIFERAERLKKSVQRMTPKTKGTSGAREVQSPEELMRGSWPMVLKGGTPRALQCQ